MIACQRMVGDLVQRKVAVIVGTGTPANLTAKTATAEIPVVFTTSSDPVKLGLVRSLNHPGGNVTGAVQMNVEIMPKLMELAHECIPTATTMALLVSPSNPDRAETLWRDAQVAARALGLQLVLLQASDERDLETTFATFVRSGAGGLVIGADSFFNSRSKQLAAAALRHAVPAILNLDNREFIETGGRMSYGGSLTASYRWAGIYTGRILKGEKPRELPARASYKSSVAGARHRRCVRRGLRDFAAGAGLADRRDAECFLDPHEPVEHLLVDAVGLLVEVRDLELGLDVDLVFDVGPHAVFRGLAVLADQHEARQEDRLERHDHRQQAERKRIERLEPRHRHDVHRHPHHEPHAVEDEERHAPRERRDHVGDPVEQGQLALRRLVDGARYPRLEQRVRLARHPAHRAEHVEAGFGTLLEQLQHVLAIEDVERAPLGSGRSRGARATVEQ